MKIITLKRTHQNTDGVFGTLDVEGIPFCQTVELPWVNNTEDISSIPTGEYICERGYSPHRGYDVYWIRNVPNRKDVEIHIANTRYDILGCIGLGNHFGVVETKEHGGVFGVLESHDAFNRFMVEMKFDPAFKLVIEKVQAPVKLKVQEV